MPIPNIYELSRSTYDPQIEEERLLSEMYKRPFSPDEWDDVPDKVKNRFGGYVRYLQAYQKTKNELEGQRSSYEQARSGTLEVPEYRMSFGEALPQSKRGIASDMSKATPSGIPEYRIRKDIRGNVSYEPIGVGGIHRTTEGQLIPESIEETQAEEQLKYAIPKMKEQAALELLKPRAERVTKQWEIEYPKREQALIKQQQEERKIVQKDVALEEVKKRTTITQQRANTAQQKADDANTRYYAGWDKKEKLMLLKNDLQKDRIKLEDELGKAKTASEQAHKEKILRITGKIPGTPEEAAKRLAEIEDVLAIEQWKEDSLAKKQLRDYYAKLKLMKADMDRKFQEKQLLELALANGEITLAEATKIAIEKGLDKE